MAAVSVQSDAHTHTYTETKEEKHSTTVHMGGNDGWFHPASGSTLRTRLTVLDKFGPVRASPEPLVT